MSEKPKKLIRNWLTGEWEEVDCLTADGAGAVSFIHDGEKVVEGYSEKLLSVQAISVSSPWVSRSIGVPAGRKDLIRRENMAAAKAGTGAKYDYNTGKCVCESEQSRNREMARLNKFDKDAGYGQRAPGDTRSF